jgi:dihydropteroate synthase
VINDITALRGDSEMAEIAAQTRAAVVAMHMQGTPAAMQEAPQYENVVEEVVAFLRKTRDRLVQSGISHDRIALDPGIGFGKTTEHNLVLLANCWRLHELGCPVMVGHSRKSFIRQLIGDKDADRTPGTIGVACALAAQGVQILRLHDVAPVRQALTLFEAAEPER